MADAKKKPWPRDAVVVVCATPETALREQMESVHPGHCMECGRDVVVDGYTLRHAAAPQLARGRPPRLLCEGCFPVYDFSQVQKFFDHRQHKEQAT